MAHRRNPTIPDLLSQYEHSGVMPPEFGVQTSARRGGRRAKVKVPKIGQWKRTPKQRGLKQGHQWRPPQGWRPASEHFYVFPAPNRTRDGATRYFYVTDGQQVLSTQHRTKAEAVRALKGLLSGAEAQLRVNSPNPLTPHEQGQLAMRARHNMMRAQQSPHGGQGAYFAGRAEEDLVVARDFRERPNPAVVEGATSISEDVYGENPLTHEEALEISGDAMTDRWYARDLFSRARRRKAGPGRDGAMRSVGFNAGKGDRGGEIATKYGPPWAARDNPARQTSPFAPAVVEGATSISGDVYGGNPLTDNEVDEVHGLADGAERIKQSKPWPDSMYYRGQEDAYSHVATDFDAVARDESGARRRPAQPRPRKKAGRKRRNPEPDIRVKERIDGLWIVTFNGVQYGPPQPTKRAATTQATNAYIWDGRPPGTRPNPTKKKAKRKMSEAQKRALAKMQKGLRKWQRANGVTPKRKKAAGAKGKRRRNIGAPQLRTMGAVWARFLATSGHVVMDSDLSPEARSAIKQLVKSKNVKQGSAAQAKELGGKWWTLTPKGKKALSMLTRGNPKAAKGKAPRRADVCTFTVPLERGKRGARCTISHPQALFKNRADALRNIQRELRARFKQLKQAPKVTRCEWRYSDGGKTKGRWHFTATKAS